MLTDLEVDRTHDVQMEVKLANVPTRSTNHKQDVDASVCNAERAKGEGESRVG